MQLHDFGKRLREYRLKSNMTQEELAQKLYVSKKTVSKWETGKGLPDTGSFSMLAKTFGVTIDELFDGKPPVSYYGELHGKLDEYALYVQSYERERKKARIWQSVVAVLCALVVTLGGFALYYRQAFLAALLHAEYTVYWKDYSQEDGEWQSQTFDENEMIGADFVITCEKYATAVVVLQETVYTSDGKQYSTQIIPFRTAKTLGGVPNEFIVDHVPAIGKEMRVVNISACCFYTSGRHSIEYEMRNEKYGYSGRFWIKVDIPEDDREYVEMVYTTDQGEKTGASKGLLKGKFAELAFRLDKMDPFVVTDLNDFYGAGKERIKEWSDGGRVVFIYEDPDHDGYWYLGHQENFGKKVYTVRVELIGSKKYKNVGLRFDLYPSA